MGQAILSPVSSHEWGRLLTCQSRLSGGGNRLESGFAGRSPLHLLYDDGNHELRLLQTILFLWFASCVPRIGLGATPSLSAAGYKSPNEKLNIASIGAGGKASSDIDGCKMENIVALCDVDDNGRKRNTARLDVPKFKDFRKMLDAGQGYRRSHRHHPDFMHATAAIACTERASTSTRRSPGADNAEARMMLETAQKYKVATQMGNQGYSNEGTRQAAEIVWSGQLGNVTEVHAWTDRPWWPQGLTSIPASNNPPDTLDWNLWQGSLEKRPYTTGGEGYPNQYGNFYQPFNWRGFFDFGCGAIGDMACHILGAPNMALKLGAPTSVECVLKEGASTFMYPKKSIVRFDFPARGNMPALKLFWHDGLKETPKIDGVPAGELLGDLPSVLRPAQTRDPPPVPAPRSGLRRRRLQLDTYQIVSAPGIKLPDPTGSLFIGDSGDDDHRHIRRADAPDSGHGKDEGLRRFSIRCSTPARHIRTDPRLQRRRRFVLQLQRRRPVRMDGLGRISSAWMQAGVGRDEG